MQQLKKLSQCCFLSTIFVLLANSATLGQWEIQNSGVHTNLLDVHFVNTLHGWAVGDSATIIATIDGGKTWQRQGSPVDTVTLQKVYFVNENVGYAVGGSGTILSTKDGGAVWLKNESSVDCRLADLSFVAADTGWVVGGEFLQPARWGVILHTTDAGQTWTSQFYDNTNSLWAIQFINKQNGWALGGYLFDNFSATYIYRTYNSGEQWEIISEAYTPLLEMSLASLDTIWAGGCAFAKSNDGGLTWSYWGGYVDFGYVQDVKAINGSTGWIKARSLLLTEDGMETWTEIPCDPRFKLRAISSIGVDNLWAVGDSGVVLKYTLGGTPVDDGMKYQIPSKFKLHQNVPNPFSSSTSICFSINSQEYITLTIYDITGRKIAALLSQTLKPGTYSVNWDGKDGLSGLQLPPGIYFCELRSVSFKVIKKMLLVR